MASSPEIAATASPAPEDGFLARCRLMMVSWFGRYDVIAYGIQCLSVVIWRAICDGDLSRLRNARDASFAKFFSEQGDNFAAYEETTVVPSLVARAHGVVLEVGAGTGNQLPRFDLARITHIYGVEPNPPLAATLATRLAATESLARKYTPLVCNIEDDAALAAAGVVPGSVDCVLLIQVMCSVADPYASARQLHRLLKPGGEVLMWEHSKSRSRMTRAVQWLWNFLWPVLVGGCRLDVPIRDAMLQAGEWEAVELQEDNLPYALLPHVWGRLVKAKKASN